MTKEGLGLFAPVIAGVFGFFGAWIGALLGLNTFKKQRAFDKRVDWYERSMSAIIGFAEAIQVADTHQSNKQTSPQILTDKWAIVGADTVRLIERPRKRCYLVRLDHQRLL